MSISRPVPGGTLGELTGREICKITLTAVGSVTPRTKSYVAYRLVLGTNRADLKSTILNFRVSFNEVSSHLVALLVSIIWQY